jgi:HEAT repeat protein
VSLYPELDGLSSAEWIEQFLGEPPDPDEATLFFGEVGALLGPSDPAFLIGQVGNPNEDRARGALVGLSFVPTPGADVEAAFVSALDDARPMVIAEALHGLAALGKPAAVERAIPLLAHDSEYVRAAAGRYLARVRPEAGRPALFAALHDPSFIVRESAIDELDEAQVVAALPSIAALTRDPHPDVREAAQTAYEHLVTLSG